jgi:D-alanyl-D-alanine carboxypeptidase (penicillin-binding protein 5/6)
MPVLGESGTQYEAQMGPGYYAPSGLLVDLSGLGTGPAAFWLNRLAWIILVPLLMVLTMRAARALGAGRGASISAASLVAANPLMLAMGSSIQNDYLAIVVATAGVLLGIRLFQSREPHIWGHFALGAMVGLAILVKVVAVALLPAILITQLLRSGVSSSVRAFQMLATTTATAATAGWWFVRNLVLYGDFTGDQGIGSLGIGFPPMRLSRVEDVVTWLGSIVSYVFVPVEYYRNVIAAPPILEILAIVMGASVLALLARAYWPRHDKPGRIGRLRQRPDRLLLLSVLCMTTIAYLVYALAVAWIAARLLFLAAPVAAIVLAAAGRDRIGRAVVSAVIVSFLVVDVWLLFSLPRIPPAEYWIF